jgi:hypothetical protein
MSNHICRAAVSHCGALDAGDPTHLYWTPVTQPETCVQSEPSFRQTSDWLLTRILHTLGETSLSIQRTITAKHIDPTVLLKAIDVVVQRHEVLRTTLTLIDNQLVQVIHSSFTFGSLQVMEVSPVDLKALETSEARTYFDYARLPLFRIQIARLATHDALIFTCAHTCMDAFFRELFFTELTDAYEHIVRGRPLHLPTDIAGISRYARWEHTELHGDNGYRHLQYWRSIVEYCGVKRYTDSFADNTTTYTSSYRKAIAAALSSLPRPPDEYVSTHLPGAVLQIQTDATPAASYATAMMQQPFQALTKLVRRRGIPFSTVVISGVNILLHKLTRLDRVMSAVVMNTRLKPEWHNVGGCLINEVLFPSVFERRMSLRTVLGQTLRQLSGAYQHGVYPLPMLLNALDVSIDSLGTVYINYINADTSQRIDTFEPYHDANAVCALELNFEVVRFANGLLVRCQYMTSRFSARTAAAITEYFVHILSVIASNEATLVDDISDHLGFRGFLTRCGRPILI